MTDRRARLEIEPLSDRRWAQIEERVFDRLDRERMPAPSAAHRRARRLAPASAIGIGLLAAAAAIALVWWPRSDTGPTLASSRVVTAADATLTVAGDVEIEVAARSSVLLIERERDAWLVAIEHGSASFRVPPRAGRPPFVVEAGLVHVEVIGTRFRVSRAPGADTATVAVDHGTVRVTAQGEAVLVHAGESWPLASEPLTAPATSASVEAPVEPPIVPDLPETTTEPLRASDDSTGERPARRTGRANLDDPTTPTASPAPQAAAESAEDSASASTSATAPVVQIPPAGSAPSDRERFARAEALERRDPATALAEYAALAAGAGPWGANALFAQGRLELELGHRERARALLERYLREHPAGLNAEDARSLLDQAR
jgi:hypothetical protein